MYTQSGRSMVEMLGVLAIIGVLSVGAIAGYSKAMNKYKLNKQTEQISSILDYVNIHMGDFKRSKTSISANMIPILTYKA
ncbi:MAG: prepilin-type N-terminal cleavage/methylation domain-containing protein [Alphaproteobacteria bacterium]|nr:prepilin-type N-terminal cleavage/methylation domain-containing protein [Alphaproteobacteria bacterium]